MADEVVGGVAASSAQTSSLNDTGHTSHSEDEDASTPTAKEDQVVWGKTPSGQGGFLNQISSSN